MSVNANTSYNELLGEVIRIVKEDDIVGAEELLEEYRRISPYADENLGWLFGELRSREDMLKAQELFGISHPVLGHISEAATEEDIMHTAFDLGKRMAQ